MTAEEGSVQQEPGCGVSGTVSGYKVSYPQYAARLSSCCQAVLMLYRVCLGDSGCASRCCLLRCCEPHKRHLQLTAWKLCCQAK